MLSYRYIIFWLKLLIIYLIKLLVKLKLIAKYIKNFVPIDGHHNKVMTAVSIIIQPSLEASFCPLLKNWFVCKM
jgi:hypothetical protein